MNFDMIVRDSLYICKPFNMYTHGKKNQSH